MSTILEALLGFYTPLAISFLYGKVRKPPEVVSQELSKILLYFFLPALLFSSSYTKAVREGILTFIPLTILSATIVLTLLPISWLIFNKEVEMVMTSIYPNAGYLPIPVAISLWGGEAVAYVGFYILGSNAMSNIIIPLLSSGKKIRKGLKRLVTFPPLYAISLALLLASLHVIIPSEIISVLWNLGSVAPTLALIVLGLDASYMANLDRDGIKVYIFRQILSPLLTLLCVNIFGISGISLKVAILEAPTSSAVTNVIISREFGLNSKKVANIVVTTTILTTIITIPLLMSIL